MAPPNNSDINTIPANAGLEPPVFYQEDLDEVLKTLLPDSDYSGLNREGSHLLQDDFASVSFLPDGSVGASIDSFNQYINSSGDGNGVQQDQGGQQEAQLANTNATLSVSVQGQPDPLFTVPILQPVVSNAEEVGISSNETSEPAAKNSIGPVKNARGKRIDSKKPYERKKPEKKPKQHEIPDTPAAYQKERRERIEREQREKDEKITHLTAENKELRKLVESLQEEKLSRTETKMLYHQLKWFMPHCVRVVKLGDNLGEAECAALSDQEKAELLNGYCPGGSCNVIIKREPESREIFLRTEHASHGSNNSSTST